MEMAVSICNNNQCGVEARVYSNQELSCYLVFFKYRWIQSFGQWEDRYEWMDGEICVAVLCRNWRLFRHIFVASFSPRVSASCSRVLFHCEVACLSLAVCAACLAQPLSFRFLTPLFRCLSAAAHRDVSRFWAISNLHRLLVPVLAWELVWTGMDIHG